MDYSHVQFCVHDRNATGVCSPEINLDQLQALFQAAAFWAKDRRSQDWAIALANSNPIVTVWDYASRNHADWNDADAALLAKNRLVGFARATSDGIYRATIWDVAIHPDYQGAGLGRKLVETVLMHPHVNRVERVYLMTTHQQKFYERIGFEENQTTTMVLFNQPISQERLSAAVEISRPGK